MSQHSQRNFQRLASNAFFVTDRWCPNIATYVNQFSITAGNIPPAFTLHSIRLSCIHQSVLICDWSKPPELQT